MKFQTLEFKSGLFELVEFNVKGRIKSIYLNNHLRLKGLVPSDLEKFSFQYGIYLFELMNTTVNICIGLHAYGYPVITPVHMYYFFEVRQMNAYILGFSGIDAASEVGRKNH